MKTAKFFSGFVFFKAQASSKRKTEKPPHYRGSTKKLDSIIQQIIS